MLFFDFEYRDNEEAGEIILLSYLDTRAGEPVTLDLRAGKSDEDLVSVYREHQDDTWCAYNAQADLLCLLALGLDIRPLQVIDLMAEARMITLTNPQYQSNNRSLLGSLEAFGIDTTIHKSTYRGLSSNQRQGGPSFSDRRFSR